MVPKYYQLLNIINLSSADYIEMLMSESKIFIYNYTPVQTIAASAIFGIIESCW